MIAIVRILALSCAFLTALAPDAARPESAPRALRYDLRVDVAATAVAWGLVGASRLAQERLAPPTCQLCAPNGFDANARDLLLWDHPDRARWGSNAVVAVVPVGVVAHQLLASRAAGDAGAGFVDLLLVAEATGIAMDLTQLAKLATGRQRPFAWYADGARRPEPADNLSFFSAHAAFAFSLVASAGTISSMRGYRSARWVWAVGMPIAALTAYLRVAADQHYLTDVLAGAAVGTAVGIAVPRLLHGPEPKPSLQPMAMALPLGVRLAF